MTEFKELEKSISSVKQLKKYVDLAPDEAKMLEKIIKAHPMRISPYYMSLIDWNDPDDPIRKMAVPSVEELSIEGIYDTSGETENTVVHGMQHKYSETALILATNQCAMYCRHCFRKRLVGLPNEEILARFEDSAAYIAEHQEINNVLISGGDPLVLESNIIKRFLEVLDRIKHVRFIRIGSRVPVTLPARLSDPKLLSLLREYSKSDKRLQIVTHFNHPREITSQSIGAVNNLLEAGVLVSNQTVLLRGVNDSPSTLATLMNRLVSVGVMPYYLFQCRPVKRVKHQFQVPLCEGSGIVEKAKANCNGLSKRFKYIMSHVTGKLEILGIMDGEIYFKYHEAKDRKNLGVMFKRYIDENAGWLDDFGDNRLPSVFKSEFSPNITGAS
jgi:lysine 2,3-aminomutase